MPPVSNPDHRETVNCIYVPTFHPGFQHWASKEQILSCLTRNSVSPQAIGYWWQFHLIIRLSGCLFLVIQLHKSTSPVFTPPENLTQHSATHPNLYAKISNLDFTNKMHILHQLNFLCPLDAPKTMLSMEAHRDPAQCCLCMVKLCQHLHLDPWIMWYEYEIWAPAQDKAFRFSITQSQLSVMLDRKSLTIVPEARIFGKMIIPVEKQQHKSRSLSKTTSVSEKRSREP